MYETCKSERRLVGTASLACWSAIPASRHAGPTPDGVEKGTRVRVSLSLSDRTRRPEHDGRSQGPRRQLQDLCQGRPGSTLSFLSPSPSPSTCSSPHRPHANLARPPHSSSPGVQSPTRRVSSASTLLWLSRIGPFADSFRNPPPDRASCAEYLQICRAVAIGFAMMGGIGYLVKLIHVRTLPRPARVIAICLTSSSLLLCQIPINNILVGAA